MFHRLCDRNSKRDLSELFLSHLLIDPKSIPFKNKMTKFKRYLLIRSTNNEKKRKFFNKDQRWN